MPTDLFERLAEINVPPPAPPVAFDRDLHDRLNQSLTAQHVVDLGTHALPAAAIEFVRAVIGLIVLTITGKFPENKQR
jgi:hypothetical protein